MAEYIVGRNSTFRQPQDAVDAILDATGGSSFTEAHSIVFLDSGIYKPFKTTGLVPTDTYDFTVHGKTGVFPSIVGSLDYENGYVGITVDAPYTTLRNLWVRNAVRGIITTADYTTIGNVHLGHCTKGGIYVWGADYFFGYNLNIHHVPFGVVLHEGTNFAMFHANVVMVPDRSYNPGACLYLNPSSGGDQILLRNNNLVSYAGHVFQINVPNMTRNYLDSDYNNIYSPSGVVARSFENTVWAQDLVEWRRKSGEDSNSVGSDPVFLNREPEKDNFTKLYVDLSLLKNSPLRDAGEDHQTESYLAHVDTAVLANDINGGNRCDTPTIGPNELVTKSAYYGLDILHAHYGGNAPCADALSILDISEDVYAKNVAPWYAKVKSGYFYIRDNQYYLYSDKQAEDLNGITWSFFDLAVSFLRDSTYVQFQGEWLDDEYWNVHGDQLILKHRDLDIETLHEQVRIKGVYQTWDTGDKTFVDNTGDYTFTLNEGTQQYFLDPAPEAGAPVVVTDELVGKMDWTGDLPLSFYMDYNETYNLPELHFNVTNLVQNSIFAYYDTGDNDPSDWYTTGVTSVDTGQYVTGDDVHPNYGNQYLNLNSGEASQVMALTAGTAYYCRVNTFPIVGDQLYLGMNHYASDGSFITSETGDVITAGGWSDLTTFTPTAATAMSLLRVFTDYNIGVEAVQLDTSATARFSRLPRPQDMTIEWEGSDKGIYEITDLTLNPITNPNTNGFLCIPNLPARTFDANATASARTLLDWGWKNGRLEYLPWAKTEGKNKWDNITHEDPYGLPELVGYTAPLQQPSTILISPSTLNIVQGTTGDELYFQGFDKNGNTLGHHEYTAYLWDETGEFPGYLAVREFGYYTQVGQQIIGETDTSGGGPVHIVPVDQTAIELVDPTPVATIGTTGDAVAFFNTRYEVSSVNHGNPTITGIDGTQVVLTGDVVTETRPSYPDRDLYQSSLTQYPWRSSVKVIDEDEVRMVEVYHNTPREGEFSVDYENRVITTKTVGAITVTYAPLVLWKDPRYNRRIYMRAGTTLPTNYKVNHDAQVWFAVKVSNQWVSKWLRSKVNYLNPDALGER